MSQFNSIRIMFVCLGNICRSPAAQGVLETLVRSKSLTDQIQVDSAGTASYHVGKLADPRMRSAASRRGTILTSKAKALTKEHVANRRLVLAMDRENLSEIRRISGGENPRVMLLSDFLDQSWPRDVPDPYYGDEAGFEYVLDMIEAACPRIIEKCCQISHEKDY